MSFQALGYAVAAIAAGSLIALQAPINTAAAARLGHPLLGAVLSFAVGTVVLIAAAALAAGSGAFNWTAVGKLPPYMLIGGGLLGATFVSASIYLTPRIGIGALLALAIAGQMAMGLMLDHFGAFGLIARELSFGRIAGALLVLAGAAMVRFL